MHWGAKFWAPAEGCVPLMVARFGIKLVSFISDSFYKTNAHYTTSAVILGNTCRQKLFDTSIELKIVL